MITRALVFVACCILLMASPALAQDACVGQTCSIDVGGATQWVLDHLLPLVTAAILAVYSILLRNLPAGVAGVLRTIRVDQLLMKALDFGVSMIVGASKDKKWDVNLGSDILAHAANYALTMMPGWMNSWVGGVDNLISMLISRLEPYLDDSVDGTQLKTLALAKMSTTSSSTTTSVARASA